MKITALLVALSLIALVLADGGSTSGDTSSGSTSGISDGDGTNLGDDGNSEYDRTLQKTSDNGNNVKNFQEKSLHTSRSNLNLLTKLVRQLQDSNLAYLLKMAKFKLASKLREETQM